MNAVYEVQRANNDVHSLQLVLFIYLSLFLSGVVFGGLVARHGITNCRPWPKLRRVGEQARRSAVTFVRYDRIRDVIENAVVVGARFLDSDHHISDKDRHQRYTWPCKCNEFSYVPCQLLEQLFRVCCGCK